MRRTKLSVCARKRVFKTPEDAQAVAVSSGYALRPYRCDRCAQLHLTSRTKGKRIPRPAD